MDENEKQYRDEQFQEEQFQEDESLAREAEDTNMRQNAEDEYEDAYMDDVETRYEGEPDPKVVAAKEARASRGSKLPLIILIIAAVAVAGLLIGFAVVKGTQGKKTAQNSTSSLIASDDLTTVSADSIPSLTDEEAASFKNSSSSAQTSQDADKSQLQIQGSTQSDGVIASYTMKTGENSSYTVPVYDFGTIKNYVVMTDDSEKAYEEAKKILDSAKDKTAWDGVLSHTNYFMAAEPADLGIAEKHYAYGEVETGKTGTFYVFQSLSTKDQGMVYGIVRVKVKNNTDEILATDDCTIIECVY